MYIIVSFSNQTAFAPQRHQLHSPPSQIPTSRHPQRHGRGPQQNCSPYSCCLLHKLLLYSTRVCVVIQTRNLHTTAFPTLYKAGVPLRKQDHLTACVNTVIQKPYAPTQPYAMPQLYCFCCAPPPSASASTYMHHDAINCRHAPSPTAPTASTSVVQPAGAVPCHRCCCCCCVLAAGARQSVCPARTCVLRRPSLLLPGTGQRSAGLGTLTGRLPGQRQSPSHAERW